MPFVKRESVQKTIPSPGQKKILSLCGGGIRGIITLEILREIERLLRTRFVACSGNACAEYLLTAKLGI